VFVSVYVHLNAHLQEFHRNRIHGTKFDSVKQVQDYDLRKTRGARSLSEKLGNAVTPRISVSLWLWHRINAAEYSSDFYRSTSSPTQLSQTKHRGENPTITITSSYYPPTTEKIIPRLLLVRVSVCEQGD